MNVFGLVKAGIKARQAFRTWREHVRAKKREKRLDEELEKGASPVEAIENVEDREMNGNLIWNIVKGAVRHALTAGGGVLVSAGFASQDEVSAAVGAVMTLVGLGFSVARKWMRSKRTGSAD